MPADYVATEPLYTTSIPGSGVAPVLVKRPGETVTAAAVKANPGWRLRVRKATQAEQPAPTRKSTTARTTGE
jgi:hypothetical protein